MVGHAWVSSDVATKTTVIERFSMVTMLPRRRGLSSRGGDDLDHGDDHGDDDDVSTGPPRVVSSGADAR